MESRVSYLDCVWRVVSVILIVYGESCQLSRLCMESRARYLDCVWRVVPVILIVYGESCPLS